MFCEYLWLDSNLHLRSKMRNVSIKSNDISNYIQQYGNHYISCYDNRKLDIIKKIPLWNYDGSSTGQGNVDNSEVILVPVNFIKHPFIDNAFLVLCCNRNCDGVPVVGNSRFNAASKFQDKANRDKCVWFGLEQEFFFFDKETKKPVEWKGHNQIKQGEYYCGVNRSSSIERSIMTDLICIADKVGLTISGINQEVAPAQWEYQIGPVEGVEAGDQMVFAKYILYMLCEKHGLYASFHPKPLSGEWNGSGCHVNISTMDMRERDDGYQIILSAIARIGEDHSNFIENYCGNNNHMRLTGSHETSDPNTFTYGVGSRDSSVRIPYDTLREKKGYFEDRRPGSSIDYYKTIAKYLDYL